MTALRCYVLDPLTGEPRPEPDAAAWGRWFGSSDEARRVAWDEVGAVVVSTVFIGLDHNHSRAKGAAAVLWETAIRTEGQWEVVGRWISREAALAGHAEAVRRLRVPSADRPNHAGG